MSLSDETHGGRFGDTEERPRASKETKRPDGSGEKTKKEEDVSEFFSDWNSSYSQMKVGIRTGEDFETEEQKKLAVLRLSNAKEKIERLFKIKDGGNSNDFDPLEYSEGFGVVCSSYNHCLRNQLDGYELFSDNIRDELKAKDKKSDELFLEAGSRLFPDVEKPGNKLEALLLIRRFKIGSSLVAEELRMLPETRDAKELIKSTEAIMATLAWGLADRQDMALRGSKDELSEKGKKGRLEKEKALYQMRLIRDCLVKSEYGREDMNLAERTKIDDVRKGVAGLEEPKKSIKENVEEISVDGGAEPTTFGELEQRALKELKGAKTVEEAKKYWTPEAKRIYLAALLAEVDSIIVRAKSFVERNPGSIFGCWNMALVDLSVGTGGLYQTSYAAETGKILPPKDLAGMSVVKYFKDVCGYDLTADKGRANVLNEYTNMLWASANGHTSNR